LVLRFFLRLSLVSVQVFTEWMDAQHGHRLRGLSWIAPRFGSFNNHLRAEMEERYGDCPAEAHLVCGFLDTARFPACRPSGSYLQQALWYNARYGHNFGCQAFEGLDGMIYDLFADVAGHQNDRGVYNASNFRQAMEAAQLGQPVTFKAYTDKGYDSDDAIESAYHGPAPVSADQHYANWLMSPYRVTVEWAFSKIKSRCPFMKSKGLMKVQQSHVIRFLKVAALLTNAHTCLAGSGTGLYYKLQAPSVTDYFA
jgi:hypothetical protein